MEPTASTFTAGQALYPLAILALGALVKWWMRGTEKSLEAVAASVAKLVETVHDHGERLAVLESQVEDLRKRP